MRVLSQGSCSIRLLLLLLFIPVEEERAFGRSPQQTGLKIMTLWLCLSSAALCLPLRNSSLNTHSSEAVAQLLAVCVPPQSFFLKYPKALLIWPPSAAEALDLCAAIFNLTVCCFLLFVRGVLFAPAFANTGGKNRAGSWERAGKKVCKMIVIISLLWHHLSEGLWTVFAKHLICATELLDAQLNLIKCLQCTNSFQFHV